MNKRESGILTESEIRGAIHKFQSENEVNILAETDNYCEYYDEKNDYFRIFYYPEKINKHHIEKILFMDNKVKEYIDAERLRDFLINEMDKNALAVCRKIALIWENENHKSDILQQLYDLYYDGYELCRAEDICGITWVEEQIIVINIFEIKQVSDEFQDEFSDSDFCLGVLSTLFHEFRHLVYECNEILEIGNAEYPLDGGIEIRVEDFGNIHAEIVYSKYKDMFWDMG